ncbi:hypothetical protein H4R18_002146 [Coemansia javaensis]|uniref:N-acetyltransferase domain-containing protein n=1 Tax=Coemansia javaensis TaxID=2761396 RepID=A0A9W8LKH2_9FUNG|nr:hypothetical protein H4R18_002146 [Coemansia javaensis]
MVSSDKSSPSKGSSDRESLTRGRRKSLIQRGCSPAVIPRRAGQGGAFVSLIPPDAEHDLATACFLSDTETMRYLKFMTRPSGYTVEDARARREHRDRRQLDKELVNYVIAIRQSQVPAPLLRMVSAREFLPARQIPIDGGHMDMDEPYLVIGCCGLNAIDLDNRCADAGIILDARFWRTGASTEALYLVLKFGFEMLGLHRIGMQTTQDNAGMRGWLEHVAGIRLECIRKEALYLGNDTYADSWDYAMFACDWYASVEKKLRARLEPYQDHAQRRDSFRL